MYIPFRGRQRPSSAKHMPWRLSGVRASNGTTFVLRSRQATMRQPSLCKPLLLLYPPIPAVLTSRARTSAVQVVSHNSSIGSVLRPTIGCGIYYIPSVGESGEVVLGANDRRQSILKRTANMATHTHTRTPLLFSSRLALI